MVMATFKVWRGDRDAGRFEDYETDITEGMVVLDAVHQIQAEQAQDLAVRWNCKAGKCGSCSAEVNGNPKLMCMTRCSDIPLDEPVTIEPMKAFPLVKDLVTDVSWNFRVKERIKPFKPRQPDADDGTWRHGAGRYRPRTGVSQVHRVFPVPGRLPRAARAPDARGLYRTAILRVWGVAGNAPAGRRKSSRRSQGQRRDRLLQHHQMLHQGLSGKRSPSPTTPSFPSRSAWSTSSTIPCSGSFAFSGRRADFLGIG